MYTAIMFINYNIHKVNYQNMCLLNITVTVQILIGKARTKKNEFSESTYICKMEGRRIKWT